MQSVTVDGGSTKGNPMADKRVAAAIEQRRTELGLTVGQMVERSGVTAPALAPLRSGEKKRYNDATKFGLARALNWPRDAVDRLFAGDKPDESWDQPSPRGASDVVVAILNDPQLDDQARRMLIGAYEVAVKAVASDPRHDL